jgi:hypothetical protein
MMVQSKTVDKESLAVYTPDRWLVGQLPTKSNICGRKWEQTRFFNDARNADHSDAPFVAVLGPHRSGTSCVAMVMHHLGARSLTPHASPARIYRLNQFYNPHGEAHQLVKSLRTILDST